MKHYESSIHVKTVFVYLRNKNRFMLFMNIKKLQLNFLWLRNTGHWFENLEHALGGNDVQEFFGMRINKMGGFEWCRQMQISVCNTRLRFRLHWVTSHSMTDTMFWCCCLLQIYRTMEWARYLFDLVYRTTCKTYPFPFYAILVVFLPSAEEISFSLSCLSSSESKKSSQNCISQRHCFF